MESCWLIRFEDGHKIIITEELYNKEKARNFDNRAVLVEEHWFSKDTCVERNCCIPRYN